MPSLKRHNFILNAVFSVNCFAITIISQQSLFSLIYRGMYSVYIKKSETGIKLISILLKQPIVVV